MDFSSTIILCVGDVILDRYVYGKVQRISPEAPVPVLHHSQTVDMMGGAGNVARNVAALGGKAVLVGIVGDDKSGKIVSSLASETPGLNAALICSAARPTICKTRFIAGQQQLIRFDDESSADIARDEGQEILAAAERFIESCDAVIISDYGKGLLTEDLTCRLIDLARARRKPVFVDPKFDDYARYRGATCITPNLKELASASRKSLHDEESIVAAARTVMTQADTAAILVTRSERGMTLVESDGETTSVPARAREVFDVSGAGDTVIAAMALVHASGRSLRQAMFFANAAAGVVVSKRGTATASLEEVLEELDDEAQRQSSSMRTISSWSEVGRLVSHWKDQGLTVGLTNGCFDVIHAGHVALLSAARARCDRLVVALNSDASVSRLKGPTRPVNALADRAQVIRAFRYVDAVVSFDEDTPLELIKALLPDILIKGGDYTPEQVVGGREVVENGGSIYICPTLAGRSTTAILTNLKQAGG